MPCVALECSYQWLQAVHKERRGRRAGGLALNIRKWVECEEPSQKNCHEQAESLKVRIRV